MIGLDQGQDDSSFDFALTLQSPEQDPIASNSRFPSTGAILKGMKSSGCNGAGLGSKDEEAPALLGERGRLIAILCCTVVILSHSCLKRIMYDTQKDQSDKSMKGDISDSYLPQAGCQESISSRVVLLQHAGLKAFKGY